MTEREFAFTSFIREYKHSIYRLSYSYMKNEQDALDVIQESVQKGWIALNTLTNVERVKSWFYTILVRTAIDLLRKQKRASLIGDEPIYEKADYDTYKDFDLYKALEQLPLHLREVVVLRYFEDLKIEEVAHILRTPISTVKSRLYKALKLLKIELEEETIVNHG